MSSANQNLEGQVVRLPEGDRAVVISHRGEWEDGVTLRRLDGEWRGSLTDRDTYAVRRWIAEARA